MASSNPLTGRSPAAEDNRIGLLRQVAASLWNLNLRASSSSLSSETGALGFCPREMRALGEILDRGRRRIAARIAELGGAGSGEPLGEPARPRDIEDPVAFMIEYRDCCRHLCRALNESIRSADPATGAMLSELAMRLEKQLWLMDVSTHDRGAESCRSVSLFLTC
jgi:hypothetical protein